MDSQTRYKRLNDGPAGRIRELAISLLVPNAEHLPSKTQLREAIAEALPGDEYAEARAGIFEKLVAVAQMGVARVDRLEARSKVDEWTLLLADRLEADEALLPSSGEDTTPEDVSGALDHLDNWNPADRNMRDVAAAAKASELEANRIRGIRGQ